MLDAPPHLEPCYCDDCSAWWAAYKPSRCPRCDQPHDPEWNCQFPGVILVCGSRDWRDPDMIEDILMAMRRPHCEQTVIHGAARGADSIAGSIARRLGYEVREFPADWRGKGKRAGIIRNLAMLDQEPDAVIAFQRNGSTGTQHTVDEARRRGIYVAVNVG